MTRCQVLLQTVLHSKEEIIISVRKLATNMYVRLNKSQVSSYNIFIFKNKTWFLYDEWRWYLVKPIVKMGKINLYVNRVFPSYHSTTCCVRQAQWQAGNIVPKPDHPQIFLWWSKWFFIQDNNTGTQMLSIIHQIYLGYIKKNIVLWT